MFHTSYILFKKKGGDIEQCSIADAYSQRHLMPLLGCPGVLFVQLLFVFLH